MPKFLLDRMKNKQQLEEFSRENQGGERQPKSSRNGGRGPNSIKDQNIAAATRRPSVFRGDGEDVRRGQQNQNDNRYGLFCQVEWDTDMKTKTPLQAKSEFTAGSARAGRGRRESGSRLIRGGPPLDAVQGRGPRGEGDRQDEG